MKPLFFTVRGLPLVLEQATTPDGSEDIEGVYDVFLGPVLIGAIEEGHDDRTTVTLHEPASIDDSATTQGPDQTQRIEFALTWLLDTLIARSFVRADQLGLTKKPIPFGDES